MAVLVLSAPWFTRALSTRHSLGIEAGLPQERMVQIAEDVRAFVTGGGGTLPSRVDERDAFDASAVSHLVDVAAVISGAARVTFMCAALTLVWLLVSLRRRRFTELADGLRAGAVLSLAFVVLAGLAGTADFDAFFSAFHGVFFSEGTWTFPYDSLLIQLFPEPFWMIAGVSWAVLVALFGGLMGLASWWARREARRTSA
jgi:integral membrane protein (TIGR01906 family)